MKRFITGLLLCLSSPAVAQQLPFTLPANTVVGRTNTTGNSGPAYAIPFSQLAPALSTFFPNVNANVGTFGSSTQCPTFTVNAKGQLTAASQASCAGSTPGGSSGQVQFNNTGALGGISGATSDGATITLVAPILGTPASVTLTNATGLPISTGVSGLGAGCATFLGTPSSANLRGCLTDETGTGLAYFQGGDIGTPSAGVATNLTGTASGLTAGSATTATTATNATNSAITNDTTTNATMFPAWVTANTGNLPIKVTSTKLTFNPSTGALSSTSFTGAGTGLTGTAASLTAGAVTTNANLTGDVTSSGNTTTLATVNANVGTFGSSTNCVTLTANAKGLVTAASQTACATPTLTSFTSTVTCGTGGTPAVSSVTGYYYQSGKIVWVSIVSTVATTGTCTGYVKYSLPVTATSTSNHYYSFSVFDSQSASTGSAFVNPADTTNVRIFKYDGTAPTGYGPVVTGFYEVP